MIGSFLDFRVEFIREAIKRPVQLTRTSRASVIARSDEAIYSTALQLTLLMANYN